MFDTVGALARFFDVFILITPLLIMLIMVNLFGYWQKSRYKSGN
jgi:DNA-binding transcriptional regulator of glucitol operon